MHTLDRDDYSSVFNVNRNDDGRAWLNNDNANPQNRWNLDNPTLFRLRYSLHFSPVIAGEFCLLS